MNSRAFVIVLVCAMWLWPQDTAWSAAFMSQPYSKAHALLISTEPGDEAALSALSATLMSDYGVAREQLTWLKGDEVTSARIERALMERMSELNPNDQFFVVFALRMHAKGDDKILVTSDFEPAQPWTGFPVLALRKLTAIPTGATVLVFHPECVPTGGVRSSNVNVAQSYNQNLQSRQTRTIVGYCAEAPARIAGFVGVLDAALVDLAKNPGTRAPWQSANDRGLVGVADLIGSLSTGEGGRELAIEAGTGWLRVTGSLQVGDATHAIAQLRTATTISDVKSALELTVAGVSGASPEVVDQAASTLSAYALDGGKDEAWRTLAVQALGDLPATTARPMLEHVYANSKSGAVRRSVLGEWNGISGDFEPELVRKALDDDDPLVRIAAIQILGLLNDTASREVILRQIEQAQDQQVRAAAVRVLAGLVGSEDDSAPLLRALKDSDPSVRVEAASAVARLPATAAGVRSLLEAFTDSEARVRESAAYALGRHWSVMDLDTSTAIAQALVRRTGEDAGNSERVAALWALARGKRNELTLEIADILRSPTALDVRLAAVDALEAFADPRGVPALVAVTEEEAVEPRLLLATIHALGQIDSRESVDKLFAMAASPYKGMSDAALAALATLRTPTPVAISLASSPDAALPLRLAAIDQLGRSGDRNSTKVLLDLLGSADAPLSQRAAHALSLNESVAMLNKLVSLLDPDMNAESVRIAAATALVAMGSDEGRSRLASYRRDPSEGVRLMVVESVDAKARGAHGTATLMAMAGDPSASVRSNVAGKLGQINAPESLQALRTLSIDDHPSVREVAIDALRSLDQESRMPAESIEEPTQVYSHNRKDGESRALRVDVFWCHGPGQEARQVRARSLADELAMLARSTKFAPGTVASIWIRPLNEIINKERGYRIFGNQIRFEPDDAWERAWVDQFLTIWGNEFVAHPVFNRTADYISFFYCGGS